MTVVKGTRVGVPVHFVGLSIVQKQPGSSVPAGAGRKTIGSSKAG